MLAEEEAITSEIVGQAHVEGYALKLFVYADNEDRAGRFGKYVFFWKLSFSGMILNIRIYYEKSLENFGVCVTNTNIQINIKNFKTKIFGAISYYL